MFDPQSFLSATTSEQGSTTAQPIPIGEHLSVIENVEARQWTSKDGSKSGLALDITHSIDSPEVKAILGRDKVTVRQGVMVDITPSGGLDMGKGKNVSLNRVREALGQNEAGKPWSPQMMIGKVCKVVIGHRPSDRPQDPPGTVFSDVNGVVKA